MLFIFASTFESSALISASPGIEGPGETVPSIRPLLPPWLLLPAIPVVIDPLAAVAPPGDPDEFAVPNVLVPGAVGNFVELPAPLGSLPELLSPPALAGPDGTPLTPCVPAPADPAFGDPTALLLPAIGPLAAPPAEAPPVDPPLPPLPLWAKEAIGFNSAATVNSLKSKCLCIVISFQRATPLLAPLFLRNRRRWFALLSTTPKV
jgi:hypothetical protein